MKKNLRKLGIEKNLLNLIKNIYKNPTANIILNDEKLNVLSLRSGSIEDCLLSPFLFNILMEVLVKAIRQENKSQTYREGKK